MPNIKLVVAYEGAAYHGWQRQPDLPTVQGELERALGELTGSPVDVAGSGRTDRGVHALGQVAGFISDAPIPGERYAPALRGYLPRDIRALSSEEMPADFHPRFSARRKTYVYQAICAGEAPLFERRVVTPVHGSVDVRAMRRAARLLVGEHDFASFTPAANPKENTVRRVLGVRIFQRGPRITFFVTGTGFLWNMVRIIVGTLLEVGRGRTAPETITAILATRDRARAGPTMPPHGLFLGRVSY